MPTKRPAPVQRSRPVSPWRVRLLLPLIVAVARPAHAQARHDSAGVNAALQQYARFVRRMASDSIGAMYLSDGVLAAPGREPVVGPAAVTAFLRTFDAYHVIAYQLHPDSVRFAADTAWQWSHWEQRVRIPAGDTVSVSGGLLAEWVRARGAGWRIRRMGTY